MLNMYTENILNHILQATRAQRRAGVAWYRLAGAYALDLAKEYNETLGFAASVIALLSPQKSWAENQRIANEAMACIKTGKSVLETRLHTTANLEKVHKLAIHRHRIWRGGIVAGDDELPPLGFLGKNAPKVKAFASNILDAAKMFGKSRGCMPTPATLEEMYLTEEEQRARVEQAAIGVTLDRHAIRVCDPSLSKTYAPTTAEHLEMRIAYVEAAIVLSRDFGIHYHPWQVQAIGWVVTRGGAA